MSASALQVEVLRGLEAIADGSSAGTPGTDLLLRPALRHEFAEFTLLRPLPAGRWDTGSS